MGYTNQPQINELSKYIVALNRANSDKPKKDVKKRMEPKQVH